MRPRSKPTCKMRPSSSRLTAAPHPERRQQMKARSRKRRRTGPYTFDDFCAMIREDQKADLIDGVIYMASPENTDDNKLFVWLITVMNLFARKRKLGQIFGSRVALRLA